MNVTSPHHPPFLASHIRPSEYNPFDPVSEAISKAFDSLKYNQSVADVVAAHLIKLKPDLNGNVHDEKAGRVNRVQLAGRASNFNGSNQWFAASGPITSPGKTQLSFSAWVRPTLLSGTKAIAGEFLTTGSQRGWLLYFNGTTLTLLISEDGGAANWKHYTVDTAFVANVPHTVGFTLDCIEDEAFIYVDGKKVSVTKVSDSVLSSIHDSTDKFCIGIFEGETVGHFQGQINHVNTYEGVWTPAEMRDLHLMKWEGHVTKPTFGFLLDGDTAHSIAGSAVLSPSGDPTLYQDAEVPDRLNKVGWNYTVYKADFSSGLGGWTDFDSTLTSVDGIDGVDDVLKLVVDSDGTNRRAEKLTPFLIVGETYDLSFDLYIPSSNAAADSIRILSSSLNPTDSVTTPTPDTWVSVSKTGLSATATDRLRIYISTGSVVGAQIAGDVFYIKNVKITSNEISGGIVPKQWGSDLDANGNGPDNANSFGVAKCQGQLIDGPCIDLDGGSEGLISGDNSDFAITGDLTLSAWINADSISSSRGIISHQKPGENENDNALYNLYLSGGAVTFVHEYGSGSNESHTFAYTVLVGTPTHLAVVRDSAAKTFKLYVNGLLEESHTYINDPTGGSLGGVGIGSSKGSNYFDGKLWDVRVYAATKTDAQIKAVYDRETVDVVDAVEIWPVSEEAGLVSKGVVNGHELAWTGGTWGLQDKVFWSDNKGCSQRELVTNGTFDSDIDGWTDNSLAGDISWEAGKLKIAGDGSNFTIADQQIETVAGREYTITYDRNGASSGQLSLRVGSSLGGVQYLNDGNTTLENTTTLTFTPTTTTTFVRFYWGSNADVFVDNASVKSTGKIPAQIADPSKDVDGFELTHKAGPHINSQASLKICNVDESPSTAARFYGAEFNGSSSVIVFSGDPSNQDWFSGDWTMEFDLDDFQNSGYLVNRNNNPAGFVGFFGTRMSVGTGSGWARTPDFNTEGSWIIRHDTSKVGVDRISMHKDGVLIPTTLNATWTDIPSDADDFTIGSRTSLISGFFHGEISDYRFSNSLSGDLVHSVPLYRDSLDWSASVNHGDDTDVTYLSETELVVELADAVTNTHTHERDSLGRITKSIVLAG